MEDVQLKKKRVYECIRQDKCHITAKDLIVDEEYDSDENKKKQALEDEVYLRYTSAKQRSRDKLPCSLLDTITQEAKKDMGLENVEVNLKRQWQFAQDNPTFPFNGVPCNELNRFSNEEKKKRQQLLNEITCHYEVERRKYGDKAAPTGTLESIIE